MSNETTTNTKNDNRYEGKVPGRTRETAAEKALATLADQIVESLNTFHGCDDFSVDIMRNGSKRYARVLYRVEIVSSHSQTVNDDMTIEEVHCFATGLLHGLAWAQRNTIVNFQGNPADWQEGDDNGGSAPVEPDAPNGDLGDDGVTPEKVLETVDEAGSDVTNQEIPLAA